eukprot:NODE_955_length_1207_cov_1197.054404_g720_i0.p2 GENE.NODE_955_length_1207_cov_1197.054404_g720_i0~~NODE_955_length_1207_cov_1197.054404_g720_i0.p2  ORF type:complete len:175 (-),score=74.59 NODE_955_length_1207_cov_1197.054404_g720_i0:683-1150(-)
MADNETGEYHTSDAGASLTYPLQCGNLKKGGYCVIKDRPCKIVEYTTSKTGKHGHAKAHIVAIDIFTNKKLEELCPTSHNMDVPNVSRTEFQLIDISDGFLSLLDDKGQEKSDVPVPNGDLGTQLEQQFADGKDLMVSIIASMGEEACVGVKETT